MSKAKQLMSKIGSINESFSKTKVIKESAEMKRSPFVKEEMGMKGRPTIWADDGDVHICYTDNEEFNVAKASTGDKELKTFPQDDYEKASEYAKDLGGKLDDEAFKAFKSHCNC